MNKLKQVWRWFWQSEWISIGILVGLIVSLGWINYQPDKYFLGWDSVWSEVDLGLAWRRAVGGVWQEFQGVGLQGGHGYVSDLVHTAWLALIAFIVPLTDVRYVSTIVLWGVGIGGAYILARRWGGRGGAMVASIIYALHPYTSQQFFVPHDAFVWLYAFLPWTTVYIYQFLKQGGRKWLLGLLLTQLILSFAGFIPPQMLGYFVGVGLIGLIYLIATKGNGWKRVATMGLVVLVAQSYWLMPFFRYVTSGSQTYLESKLNAITTPENELKSRAYGQWSELILGKGYYYESLDVMEKVEGSGPILESWIRYWDGENAKNVMVGFFGLTFLGLLVALGSKSWQKITVVVLWLFALMGLRGGLIDEVPLLGQAFRIGFTKFASLYVLFGALLTAILLESIGKFTKRLGRVVLVLLVAGGMIGVSWPVWRGELFYKRLRVDLPIVYLDLMKEMKKLDKTERVVLLPANSYNGWYITSWGYTGSGFWFYGIEQPILDRAFDVWSPYNEGFYNQISTALYGCESGQSQITNSPILKLGCEEQVARVLQKYDVRYVLLDESVIAPGQGKEILRIEETKKLASELGWDQKFHEGFLTVWDRGVGGESFVSAPSSYTLAEGDTIKTREDVIYVDNGNYVSGIGGMQYPFAGLMREETKGVEWGDGNVKSVTQLNSVTVSQLIIPGWEQGEWVEMGYEMRIVNNELRVDWEAVYRVGEQEGPRLASIKYQVASSMGGMWVQIAGNEAKYVKDGEMVRGRAKLQVGMEIPIKIYDGQGRVEKVRVGEEQKCGEYRCWATPLEKAPRDSLVQTITHYEGDISPEVCLDLDGEPYECVNAIKRGESPVVVMTAVAKGERYWLDWVVRESGTPMKEPGVVRYEMNGQWLMDNGQWEPFLREQTFDLQGQALKVEVAGEPKTYDFAKMGKKTISNCDVLVRGSAGKEGVKYTADERGAACDYVEMTELDTRLPYLMRLQGENVAGRSVKLFLWNSGSKRNDLEYLLGKSKFDQTFALLPWQFPGAYSLNIETRSFGESAENNLEPVEVMYFPLKQMAGAKIITNHKFSNSPIENELRITNVKKTGTWLYRVETKGTGLLRLSQGYDEGWVGIGMEHVKVDGWANGWLVGEQSSNPKFSNSQIIIFYWPQLLEYFGFGLLGITIVILIVYDTKRYIN